MSEKERREYQEFLENVEKIEENLKCDNCNKTSMVHVTPEGGYVFLCDDCGNYMEVDPNEILGNEKRTN